MAAAGKGNRNIELEALVRDGLVFESFAKGTGVANGACVLHIRYQRLDSVQHRLGRSPGVNYQNINMLAC